MDRRQFLSVTAAGGLAAAVPFAPAQADLGLSQLPPVRARRADGLVRSYMLNTKISFAPTVYGHTDAVVDLLQELGVRSIRERITTATNAQGTQNQMRAMPVLARSGIRWHATVGLLEDWRHASRSTQDAMDLLTGYYRRRVGGDLSDLMHSLGGCNEVNKIGGDPQWAPHARVMQRALWRHAKADRHTRDIPVAGPSTRTDLSRAEARTLGDLSGISDWANGHLYQRGVSPTKFVDEHLRTLSICFPGARRTLFSETGYNNSPQNNQAKSLPEDAAATYAIRGICDFYRRGAIYGRFELLDDPNRINRASQQTINQTAEREAHFGLVAMTKPTVAASTPGTWRKKPEFYATKRLLHLLSDRGGRFTPDPLRVRVTGGGNDLQQLLLQKSNGKHYLVLWRDVEVSTCYARARRLKVPLARFTIHLGTARPTAIYDPRHTSRPVATHAARRRIDVRLGGDLMVVEIG